MKNHFSPRTLADAVGVSESSIKRWVDAGKIGTSLTAGGHRRIPLREAVRFIRETNRAVIAPEALGLGGAPGVAAHGESTALLLDHLEAGRAQEAAALIQALYVSGEDVAHIVDGPVAGALDQIGTRWTTHPDEGIFLEHRATQICVRGVHALSSLIPTPGERAPLAVGGAPDDDPYVLPSLCAAIVLESVGLKTSNLGPNTPVASFRAAIELERPELVWLSLSSPRDPVRLRPAIEHLSAASAEVGATLVIGGRGSGTISGNDSRFVHGRSMVELSAFASGFARRSSLSRADRRPEGP